MPAPEIKPHVLIVEARFYSDIAEELAKGAIAALSEAQVTYERLQVPGAFEFRQRSAWPCARCISIRIAVAMMVTWRSDA